METHAFQGDNRVRDDFTNGTDKARRLLDVQETGKEAAQEKCQSHADLESLPVQGTIIGKIPTDPRQTNRGIGLGSVYVENMFPLMAACEIGWCQNISLPAVRVGCR
jgi:hypothetical protein